MKLKILTITLLAATISLRYALAQTGDTATNQPVTAEAPSTNTQPVDASATNPPVATVAGGDTAATPVADTNSMSPASIPLIQFQDVPITTAIENLARQAGINYLLDPRIGYGQPDQNGQIKAEPQLSIRWENITAENALVALLDNYGLQLVEDHRTGIARITAKDPAAPPPLITRVIQLKYSSTSNMVQSVEASLTDKRSRVIPDTRTSQMVVVATEEEQEAVDTLVSQLDKPTRQVLIEAKLVEISSNPSTAKGVDWSGTLAAQHVGFGNNVLGGASGQPYTQQTTYSSQTNVAAIAGFGNYIVQQLTTYGANNTVGAPGLLVDTAKGFDPATFFLNADGVSAVLSFLNSSSDAQVISTPRVVTLDNETATISVTRAFPVINVTAGTQNTAGGSSITYSNLGTTLEVTPRISANDYIWLKVIPDVSSFFGVDSKTIGGQVFQADVFDSRHIETQVLIPNANTLVMGGLVKDNPQASYTKVPLLGDIPLVGYAFRSENKSLDKDNLLIFITPTIVRDADFKPTATTFLDSKPNLLKAPLNPNSWWDGSKPRGDWSNPAPEPGEFDKH